MSRDFFCLYPNFTAKFVSYVCFPITETDKEADKFCSIAYKYCWKQEAIKEYNFPSISNKPIKICQQDSE